MADGDRLRTLAKRAGPERQVSAYVRGRGNPTFTTLLKLADGLGVPLHVLMLRAHELQAQDRGKHDAALRPLRRTATGGPQGTLCGPFAVPSATNSPERPRIPAASTPTFSGIFEGFRGYARTLNVSGRRARVGFAKPSFGVVRSACGPDSSSFRLGAGAALQRPPGRPSSTSDDSRRFRLVLISCRLSADLLPWAHDTCICRRGDPRP
jgi:transcriptional regulator with XRE-family HTH domain